MISKVKLKNYDEITLNDTYTNEKTYIHNNVYNDKNDYIHNIEYNYKNKYIHDNEYNDKNKYIHDFDLMTYRKISAYNTKRAFYEYLITKFYYSTVRKKLNKYMQHGQTTVMKHCRNVAYFSYTIAKFLENHFKIHFDYETLVIGAYLHDLFLYDWHEKNKAHRLHGFTHPKLASENAQFLCHINEKTKKIIESHMWPLTVTKVPKSREAILVCLVDKYSAIMETLKGHF